MSVLMWEKPKPIVVEAARIAAVAIAADFTPLGYFFSYPYAALNDGSVIMMGYTYAGRVEYFVW
jgi:hypothetical protein